MINVKVLFFGATADATGERELSFAADENAAAKDVFAEIIEKYPQLKKRSLLFSVNQEYSNGGEALKENDELAIFTAVSGG